MGSKRSQWSRSQARSMCQVSKHGRRQVRPQQGYKRGTVVQLKPLGLESCPGVILGTQFIKARVLWAYDETGWPIMTIEFFKDLVVVPGGEPVGESGGTS